MARKKIILVGPSAAGKTTIKEYLETAYNLKAEISYTTRPPRPMETDGKDYYFIFRNRFENMIAAGEFIQWKENMYNLYGTSKEEFDRCDLFIMTPNGVSQLPDNIRKQCFVVYLTCKPNIMIERMKDRGHDDAYISKRIKMDEQEFKGYTSYDEKFDTSDSDKYRASYHILHKAGLV